MDESTTREVTELLQGILLAIRRGELDATTPNARALLRRLEGATIALELTLGAESGTQICTLGTALSMLTKVAVS